MRCRNQECVHEEFLCVTLLAIAIDVLNSPVFGRMGRVICWESRAAEWKVFIHGGFDSFDIKLHIVL